MYIALKATTVDPLQSAVTIANSTMVKAFWGIKVDQLYGKNNSRFSTTTVKSLKSTPVNQQIYCILCLMAAP